jgi:hypothetical protein
VPPDLRSVCQRPERQEPELQRPVR